MTTSIITFRVSEQTKRAITRAAKEANLTVSVFVGGLVGAYVERQRTAPTKPKKPVVRHVIRAAKRPHSAYTFYADETMAERRQRALDHVNKVLGSKVKY